MVLIIFLTENIYIIVSISNFKSRFLLKVSENHQSLCLQDLLMGIFRIPYFIMAELLQNFHGLCPNSFATMSMNEFLSDRYVSLFFTHHFGKLLFHIKKFRPEFAIASNIGFGTLSNSSHHYNIEIKTMEKGFFESGLMLENLLNATYYKLGAGIFIAMVHMRKKTMQIIFPIS